MQTPPGLERKDFSVEKQFGSPKRRQTTVPVWPVRMCSHRPLRRSQTRAVLSRPPEMITSPPRPPGALRSVSQQKISLTRQWGVGVRAQHSERGRREWPFDREETSSQAAATWAGNGQRDRSGPCRRVVGKPDKKKRFVNHAAHRDTSRVQPIVSKRWCCSVLTWSGRRARAPTSPSSHPRA